MCVFSACVSFYYYSNNIIKARERSEHEYERNLTKVGKGRLCLHGSAEPNRDERERQESARGGEGGRGMNP